MEITVVSMRGVPVQKALSARFGSAGGSIGRADTNTLVLEDPERTVSRVHAQVLWRQGQFFIVDHGSNPLSINGSVLGSGREKALADADLLQIGGFELKVSACELAKQAVTQGAADACVAGTADDPFADLMVGLAPTPGPPAALAPVAPVDSFSLFPDPLGLAQGAAGASTPPAASTQDNPLADLLGSVGQAGEERPLVALDVASSNIDELFGLAATASPGLDPLAHSPLAAPLVQPNTAQAMDPLQALQSAVRVGQAAQPDQTPLLQQAFAPPLARPEQQAPVPPPSVDTSVSQGVAAAALDFDFGDEPLAAPVQQARAQMPEEPAAAIAAQALMAQPPAQAPALAPSESRPAGTARSPAVAPPVRSDLASAAPAAATAVAQPDQLLAALLQGLGSSHHLPTELTPELMHRLGVLLRSATDGVLQLLLARQEFKHGLRAQVTLIATQTNNPLKFSPSAEVALAHLLGEGTRGFMPAEEAMANAFADLRAHQLGMVVGLRAAFAHVLQVFTPEQLERRISEKSRLDALFSANRKARLWDQYCQFYTHIASEAEDDFHHLIGQAFAQAYDEQMERFRSGG